MANIQGVTNTTPVTKVTQPIQKQVPAGAPAQLKVSDRLELSGMSHLLKSLKTSDVRVDKVAAIREQIQNGTYEDDKKLDIAVDRLLDDLLA